MLSWTSLLLDGTTTVSSRLTMASNCHGVEPIGSVKRWSKAAGTMIDVPQPHLINKYNKNMGGVHRMDQNIGAYRISMINPFTKVVVAPIRLPAWRRHAERIADLSTYGGQEPSADWSAGVSTQCMQCILQKVHARTHVYRENNGAPEASESASTRLSTHGWQPLQPRRCAVCGTKVKKQCLKCNVGLHMECFKTFLE